MQQAPQTQPIPRVFAITEHQRGDVLAYLETRPHREVHLIIAGLGALPELDVKPMAPTAVPEAKE
jgi:hypothetical protein